MTFGTFHKFIDRNATCEVFKLNERDTAELGGRMAPGWYWWERSPTGLGKDRPHGPYSSRRQTIFAAHCEPDQGIEKAREIDC